jgi:hypothetical protein
MLELVETGDIRPAEIAVETQIERHRLDDLQKLRLKRCDPVRRQSAIGAGFAVMTGTVDRVVARSGLSRTLNRWCSAL